VAIVLAIGVANAQNPGDEKVNLNPGLSLEICTGNQQCQQVGTKVTMDSNWRWFHTKGGYNNCYDGNMWSSECSDPNQCIETVKLRVLILMTGGVPMVWMPVETDFPSSL